MKKLITGIVTGALLLGGAATYVSAHTDGDGTGIFGFEEMKPYMEEMHPNFSEDEQREMFNSCHGEGGLVESNSNSFQGMMNNF